MYYIYFFPITGPYYRFRTFQDLYETPYAKYAYCTADMLIRLSRVPIYVILFLFSGYLFPLDAVKNEDFYETSSFIWRIFYMTPVFFNFRMRFHFVKLLITFFKAWQGAIFVTKIV